MTSQKHFLFFLSNHRQDACFIVLVVIACCFKLWKAKYGISEFDEAFYLTIPHRMSLGDSLFFNEWHPSQMFGLLLYPFYWLYMSVFGTTEGIQLVFRYIYVVFHLLVVLFVYIKIKKYGFLTVLGCLSYFLFTPFQLMALSYNTMCLDFLLLAGVIMATYYYKKKRDVIKLLIAGFFFSAAVLCCPYLVFVYFLFFFISFFRFLFEKIRKTKISILDNEIWRINSFIFFSIGCTVLATVFIWYIFSHMNMNEFLNSIKYILNDSEHMPVSLQQKTIIYFKQFIISPSIVYIASLSLCVITFFIMLFDKNRNNHKFIYVITACMFSCVFLYFGRNIIFNAFMIPISFMGLYAFVLSKNKNWNLFFWIYVLGIIYSFAINLASNTKIYAIGIAFAIPTLCSFIFINEILKEILIDIQKNHSIVDKSLVFVLLLSMVYFLGIESFDTLNHCLWDGNVVFPRETTEKIENGPSKGVITTADRKALYDSIYCDIKILKKQNKPILCLTNQAWVYLGLETSEYATFSAWLPEDISTLTRLEEYYSIYPEKTPYYIYIPDTGGWDDIQKPVKFFENKGYIRKKCKSGYSLEFKKS